MEKQGWKADVDGRLALAITGMTCAGCVGAIKRVLARVPGVAGVTVDLDAGRALVDGTARPEDVVTAIQSAGYGAQLC